MFQLAPEIFQFLRAQPALQKRARIDAGRGMPLEVHGVTLKMFATCAEKVVEPHFV